MDFRVQFKIWEYLADQIADQNLQLTCGQQTILSRQELFSLSRFSFFSHETLGQAAAFSSVWHKASPANSPRPCLSKRHEVQLPNATKTSLDTSPLELSR